MARPNSMDLWECAMERLDRGQTVRQVAAAGFERVRPKLTGRPGYDPAGLLKLCIYGYLNRIHSSRRLETETHRNLEMIWLLRRVHPDFKTVAAIRACRARLEAHMAFSGVLFF